MEIRENEKLNTIIKLPNGKYVNIDTCFIDHVGWYTKHNQCQYESIIKPCDKNGNWHKKPELFIAKYRTWAEAKAGHDELVERWTNAK